MRGESGKMGPFFPYPGGKTRFIDRIKPYWPSEAASYWEPFVGAGAMFFAVRDAGLADRHHINDANPDIVDAYRAVQDQPEEVVRLLQQHERAHLGTKDWDYSHYFEVRNHGRCRDYILNAARFVYLIRACWGQNLRYKPDGSINAAPRREKPGVTLKEGMIYKPEQIMAAHRGLTEYRNHPAAMVTRGDFAENVKPGAGDFVYADPPYTDHSMAHQYSPTGWTWDDFMRFRDKVDEWVSAGATVLISDGGTSERVREAYSPYPVVEFDHTEGLQGRKVTEILVVANP